MRYALLCESKNNLGKFKQNGITLCMRLQSVFILVWQNFLKFKPLCLKELSNVPPIGNTEAVLPLRLIESSVWVTDEFRNKAKQEMFLKTPAFVRSLPLAPTFCLGLCRCLTAISENSPHTASFSLILSKGSRNCSKWFNQAATSHAFSLFVLFCWLGSLTYSHENKGR